MHISTISKWYLSLDACTFQSAYTVLYTCICVASLTRKWACSYSTRSRVGFSVRASLRRREILLKHTKKRSDMEFSSSTPIKQSGPCGSLLAQKHPYAEVSIVIVVVVSSRNLQPLQTVHEVCHLLRFYMKSLPRNYEHQAHRRRLWCNEALNFFRYYLTSLN